MTCPSDADRTCRRVAPAFLVPLMLMMFAAGCVSTPARAPVTAGQQNSAIVPGYENIRFSIDASEQGWQPWAAGMFDDRLANDLPASLNILALSSGADNGAFGAGYLVGWAARGDRPRFDIVTGVSTGALIAPFAFMGPEYDNALEQLYTQTSAQSLYRLAILNTLLGSSSIADNSPLQSIIAGHVTAEFVDLIGSEHRRGRRLLVLTTNLDAQDGIVWDIGAIAISGAPDRVDLIREVLLASAGIPGLLPPVMISVQGGGQTFEEMHVDGGVSSSTLLVPLTELIRSSAALASGNNGSVTVLYNNVVWARYAVTQPTTLAIMSRSLDSIVAAADRARLRDYALTAIDTGFRYRLLSIGEDFEMVEHNRFDQDFMRSLFAYGRERAVHDVTE